MPPARPSSFSSFSWGHSFHRDLTSDDDFFLVIQQLKPLLDVVLGGGSAIELIPVPIRQCALLIRKLCSYIHSVFSSIQNRKLGISTQAKRRPDGVCFWRNSQLPSYILAFWAAQLNQLCPGENSYFFLNIIFYYYTKEKVTVLALRPPCRQINNLPLAPEDIPETPVSIALPERLKFTFQNIHCRNNLTDGNINS